jgi:hypothetical protein
VLTIVNYNTDAQNQPQDKQLTVAAIRASIGQRVTDQGIRGRVLQVLATANTDNVTAVSVHELATRLCVGCPVQTVEQTVKQVCEAIGDTFTTGGPAGASSDSV